MKMYYRENQVECFNCGETFVPDQIPTIEKSIVAVTCPNGERGSWTSLVETQEFCVPVEVQAIRMPNGTIDIWIGDQNRFGDFPGAIFMNEFNMDLFS